MSRHFVLATSLQTVEWATFTCTHTLRVLVSFPTSGMYFSATGVVDIGRPLLAP
jgi:hypothetical protein